MMSKNSDQTSSKAVAASPIGSASVDRALSLLHAFKRGDETLSANELAQRAHLPKSTTQRFLASLEHARLIQRHEDGQYALGIEIARLYALYTASFSLSKALMPIMRELVTLTQESVAFHIRQGDQRLCLLRIDSPQLVRDHILVGDVLPLARGAGGRVLMAFSGAKGVLYEQIRRDGIAVLTGDRTPELTGISAPVFGLDSQLRGALTLTLPEHRFREEFVDAVRRAARRATLALGGSFVAIKD